MKFIFLLVTCVFFIASVVDSVPTIECPHLCSLVLAPVCGRDHNVNEERVFSNECMLEATNCLEKKSFLKVRNGLC